MRLISLAQAAQSAGGGASAPKPAVATPAATPLATPVATPGSSTAPTPTQTPTVTKMNPSDSASQEKAFKTLDKDGDGVVSLTDTKDFLMASLGISNTTVHEVCNMLSPGGNGFNLGGFRQAVLLSSVAKSKTNGEAVAAAQLGAPTSKESESVWHPISPEEDANYATYFARCDQNSNGRVNASDVKQVWPPITTCRHLLTSSHEREN